MVGGPTRAPVVMRLAVPALVVMLCACTAQQAQPSAGSSTASAQQSPGSSGATGAADTPTPSAATAEAPLEDLILQKGPTGFKLNPASTSRQSLDDLLANYQDRIDDADNDDLKAFWKGLMKRYRDTKFLERLSHGFEHADGRRLVMQVQRHADEASAMAEMKFIRAECREMEAPQGLGDEIAALDCGQPSYPLVQLSARHGADIHTAVASLPPMGGAATPPTAEKLLAVAVEALTRQLANAEG